jgi:hypothetical protein
VPGLLILACGAGSADGGHGCPRSGAVRRGHTIDHGHDPRRDRRGDRQNRSETTSIRSRSAEAEVEPQYMVVDFRSEQEFSADLTHQFNEFFAEAVVRPSRAWAPDSVASPRDLVIMLSEV